MDPDPKKSNADQESVQQLLLLAQLSFEAAADIIYRLTKEREHKIENESAFISKCVTQARKELSGGRRDDNWYSRQWW